MSISMSTRSIVANDSTGKLAAYAEHDGKRWAIYVPGDMRMDEPLGPAITAEASRRMNRETLAQQTASLPAGSPLKPAGSAKPTVGMRDNGLLLPESITETDVREALRDVATFVDGYRERTAKVLDEAVNGIIGTVARAGAPRLPLER